MRKRWLCAGLAGMLVFTAACGKENETGGGVSPTPTQAVNGEVFGGEETGNEKDAPDEKKDGEEDQDTEESGSGEGDENAAGNESGVGDENTAGSESGVGTVRRIPTKVVPHQYIRNGLSRKKTLARRLRLPH